MADKRNETLKRLRAIRSGLNRGVVTKYSMEVMELIGTGDDSAKGRLCRLCTIASLLDELKQLRPSSDVELFMCRI